MRKLRVKLRNASIYPPWGPVFKKYFFSKTYSSLIWNARLAPKVTFEPYRLEESGIFSKHRPSGRMLSISRNVRLSVCLSVRLCVCLFVCSLLRYFLVVFLPTLPDVGCPIFFRDSEWEEEEKKVWIIQMYACSKLPHSLLVAPIICQISMHDNTSTKTPSYVLPH